MKVSIIGGAGIRTPLLVRGLAGSGLPLREVALYDTDRRHLAIVHRLAQAYAGGLRVTVHDRSADCMAGSRFVFTSIREGGTWRRARDERACVELGILGQETVGPAGFALASRNIPPLVGYAREAAEVAPDAWIVNFTNPVSIVTQAVWRESGARIVGICDTPSELFHRVASALGLEVSQCRFDYFGLNHLGWLREVYAAGRPHLHRLLDDPDRLRRAVEPESAESAWVSGDRLLPTEYVYYYERPLAALANLQASGRTRGEAVHELNQRLLAQLRQHPENGRRTYEEYLEERSRSYMELETGHRHETRPEDGAGGYDRIAVTVAAGLDAGGYNNVCNIGEEIRTPHKTIPRAIVGSIVLVVLLYVVMSTVILGMIPWQEAQASRTIASLFIERTFQDPEAGRVAGLVMTALILFVTASSLYALILGYSRIPFAAARDGQFFEVFARVHPTKHFPHVSLVTIGAIAIPFCFFSLGRLVNWLILVQIVLQFIWQCAGVILLRRYRPDIPQPFRMWLYPVPALVALAMWLYVFVSAPLEGILFALAFLALSIGAYWVFVSRRPATAGA